MPNTTLPADPIADTLAALWPPLLGITTHDQGCTNGEEWATGRNTKSVGRPLESR